MKSKHYKIKIYRHHNNEWQQVVECPVSLIDPPKIEKSAGEDAWFDERRDMIEKTLEADLRTGGVEAVLKRYKPLNPQRPVVKAIFDDFSWTVEEEMWEEYFAICPKCKKEGKETLMSFIEGKCTGKLYDIWECPKHGRIRFDDGGPFDMKRKETK